MVMKFNSGRQPVLEYVWKIFVIIRHALTHYDKWRRRYVNTDSGNGLLPDDNMYSCRRVCSRRE